MILSIYLRGLVKENRKREEKLNRLIRIANWSKFIWI